MEEASVVSQEKDLSFHLTLQIHSINNKGLQVSAWEVPNLTLNRQFRKTTRTTEDTLLKITSNFKIRLNL